MAAMNSEKITFPGSQGYALAARLERPPSTPRATAIFAHYFTCSKDIFAASRIARELSARGFQVLRFDFTGLGASDGEFANTNFSSNVQDRFCTDRQYLFAARIGRKDATDFLPGSVRYLTESSSRPN